MPCAAEAVETMSCEMPRVVREYIEQIESGEPRCSDELTALAKLVRRAFETEDITVDTEQLERYLSLVKYFPYETLYPWEEFLLALWDCTYNADGTPRWDTLFCMVSRGAGKDGFIAFDGACCISPYNPAASYDVDICALNEEQAMRPVKDLTDVLETPGFEKKLNRHYYHTKELAQGRKNRGTMRGRTNNPKGRDGMRSGKIIFNEVHQYENYDNIKVFKTGLGKKQHPRTGIFTSNGHVNDGPLDDFLAQGRRILFEDEPDSGFLPFICCIRDKSEVDDERNWYKANPSLAYTPSILQETRKEYREWKERPEQNGDFLAKRMGLRAGFQEISVTDYEKLLATKKILPELKGRSCVVGIDYAELDDWAAIDLHFKIGQQRYDINHAWICTQSKTLHRVRAPWREWAELGHVTVVDDVSIHPDLLAAYIREAGRRYNIKMLSMDHYRWTLVSESMKKIGFDASDRKKVKLVRPSDIMQTEPVIQECFNRELLSWGDCPHLRWACNNTKRVPSSRKLGVDTGNFIYAKIEAKSRKTDPFMAFVAAMCAENALGSGNAVSVPSVGVFKL